MAAVTSIMRAQQIYLSRVDQVLRGLGLTFARYELLALLSFTREGCLPLGKLGARLQVHPASITNAVNRLEADGLISRIPHHFDRRTTLAQISPAGLKLVSRATAELNAKVFEVPGISQEEAGQLFYLLKKLRLSAGDFQVDRSDLDTARSK